MACMFLFAACTAERNPCLEPTLAKLNIGYYQYKADTRTYIDSTLPNANIVSLDIDSAKFWYWGSKGLNKFSLVLSPLRDTARWTIQVDSGYSRLDTLAFIYERKLKFYSNACGYSYTYSLKEVLHTVNNLDSVIISDNEVTTKAGVEHVKVYL
jgi:hypothetical protein